jgi:hypothetical protein
MRRMPEYHRRIDELASEMEACRSKTAALLEKNRLLREDIARTNAHAQNSNSVRARSSRTPNVYNGRSIATIVTAMRYRLTAARALNTGELYAALERRRELRAARREMATDVLPRGIMR